MRISAHEEGKYAVPILYKNSLVICHTDSEELTIIKDAEALARLLDTDNIDKYACSQRTNDETEVLQFERSVTKFFSEFLCLKPEEIAYKGAGEIKVALG